MATTVVKVNIAHLRQTARAMEATADSWKKEAADVRRAVESLCSPQHWQGNDATIFSEGFAERVGGLESIGRIYGEYAQDLKERADRYEALRARMEQTIVKGRAS